MFHFSALAGGGHDDGHFRRRHKGILLRDRRLWAVSVTATEAISTTGADAEGIYVRGTSSSIVITSTGSVSAGDG
jgi:hypothetical protein